MRLKFVVGSVLLAILMTAVPSVLHAQVRVGVAIAVAAGFVCDWAEDIGRAGDE